MDVVADASILVEVFRPEGAHARRWLTELLDGDQLHWVRGLTELEVLAAIRNLCHRDPSLEWWASKVHSRLIEFPATREVLTQTGLRRVWELRRNLTPYDAAYVALTEALQATIPRGCAFATADQKFTRSPGVVCPVRLYVEP